MINNIKIPIHAQKILTHLESAGFEAFVVGGCVRDSLRGVVPYDWDICTNAKPEQTINVFKNIMSVIPTGIKHGTVTILSDGIPTEVTTYRTDGNYTDNRHPECVNFISSVKGDLARRDFTVNAIAYSPNAGIVDPFDGMDDIKNKIICCVGNPQTRFEEDALRILRALRFSAVCSFNIEDKTKKAIKSNKSLLKNISAERIIAELKKLILADKPSDILIDFTDVIETCITYSADITYLKMTDLLPKDIPLRMAALLGGADRKETSVIMNNLKAENSLKSSVCAIAENSDIKPPNTKSEMRHMLHHLGVKNTYNILTFKATRDLICENTSDFKDSLILLDEVITANECFSLETLAINGSDIITLGVSPGHKVGEILNHLLSLVIDGKIQNTKTELLNYAKQMI